MGVRLFVIPDYSELFEMILEYARDMKGGHSIPDIMKMKTNEFLFWYRLQNREIARESILNEYASKDKPVPSSRKAMNRLIDKKLAEWRGEA